MAARAGDGEGLVGGLAIEPAQHELAAQRAQGFDLGREGIVGRHHLFGHLAFAAVEVGVVELARQGLFDVGVGDEAELLGIAEADALSRCSRSTRSASSALSLPASMRMAPIERSCTEWRSARSTTRCMVFIGGLLQFLCDQRVWCWGGVCGAPCAGRGARDIRGKARSWACAVAGAPVLTERPHWIPACAGMTDPDACRAARGFRPAPEWRIRRRCLPSGCAGVRPAPE